MGRPNDDYTGRIVQGEIGSVVALHGGALGDFVLTLQVLSRLRDLSSTLRLDVVARSPFSQWVAGRGIVDRSYSYEAFGVERLFAAEADPIPSDHPIHSHDLIVNFMSGEDAAPAIGLRGKCTRPVINVDPNPTAATLQKRRHITDQWMQALKAAGLPLADRTPTVLRIGVDEKVSARNRLALKCGKKGGPLAIVHPGSGGRAKCAPLDIFETHVESLRGSGYGVAWIIGPTEMEWYGRPFVERLQASAPVIHEEDVGRAADWVMGADRYVGNDAGMTHVASALDVPTMVLFVRTDPLVWGPVGADVEGARSSPWRNPRL